MKFRNACKCMLTQLLGCLGSLKLPHLHRLQSGIDPICTAMARNSAHRSPVQAGADDDQLDHRSTTAADHHGGDGDDDGDDGDDDDDDDGDDGDDDDDDDPSTLDALFGSIDSPAYLSDSNRSNFISFDASVDRDPLQVITILNLVRTRI
jgi:hypothetical protein